MRVKLFAVTVALSVWKRALRLSDKVKTNTWLALLSFNFVLLLILNLCFPGGTRTPSVSERYSSESTRVMYLMDYIGPRLSGSTTSQISRSELEVWISMHEGKPNGSSINQQIIKNRIFETRSRVSASSVDVVYIPSGDNIIASSHMDSIVKPLYLENTYGHVFVINHVASHFAIDMNTPVNSLAHPHFEVRESNNDSILAYQWGGSETLSSAVTPSEDKRFFQHDGFPLPTKRFLPEVFPSYQASVQYPAPVKESFWKQLLSFAPLLVFIVQFFLGLLAAISFYRKWAEGVQLKLSIEKMHLEIEEMKKEAEAGLKTKKLELEVLKLTYELEVLKAERTVESEPTIILARY